MPSQNPLQNLCQKVVATYKTTWKTEHERDVTHSDQCVYSSSSNIDLGVQY